MKSSIKIQIDADLESIVPDFLKNRNQDLISLGVHLNEEDYDAIRIIGHSMKGAGASYGFEFISRAGAAIEEAAKARDKKTIVVNKAALTDFLERIHIEFIQV